MEEKTNTVAQNANSLNEKSVRQTVRYYYASHVAKAAVYTTPLFLITSPLICFGEAKYKKRFAVLPILFILGLLMMIPYMLPLRYLYNVDPVALHIFAIIYGVGLALIGLSALIAYSCLCVLAGRVNKDIEKYIKSVIREIGEIDGSKAQKEFRKELYRKSLACDVDGFVADLELANARYVAEKEAKAMRTEQARAATSARAEALGGNSAKTFGEPREHIKSKTSERGRKVYFGITVGIYAVLLIVGILLVAVPSLGNVIHKIGICEEISARAYGITIGTMWLVLVPTFGLYFATVSPFEIDKKVRTIVFAITASVSVALIAVFFVIIYTVKIDGFAVRRYFESDDSWFIPATAALAVGGMIICHALTMFKLNPDKIKTNKPQNSGGVSGLFKYVLGLLGYLFLKMSKGILKFKESRPELYIVIATLLLTWLAYFTAFFVSIVFIVALVCVLGMVVAGMVETSYSVTSSRKEYYTEDIYGNKIELERLPYSKNGYDVYVDKYGKEYYTDDNGVTFYTNN